MARKTAKAKNRIKAVRIGVVGAEDATKYYSNFVHVAHTPYEFTITFAHAEPPTEQAMERARRTGIFTAPVKCQITLPEKVLVQLIEAMKSNHEKFLKTQSKSEKTDIPKKSRG